MINYSNIKISVDDEEYLHAFRNIEFAVYCPPQDDRNYRIFERVIISK